MSQPPLDTRRKIVRPESIDQAVPITLVSGYFDPLLASHAAKLAEIRRPGRKLAVVVCEPPEPVTPLLARAELVAALKAVDYVLVTEHNNLAEIIERVGPAEILQEEEADRERTRELIAHVRARHSA